MIQFDIFDEYVRFCTGKVPFSDHTAMRERSRCLNSKLLSTLNDRVCEKLDHLYYIPAATDTFSCSNSNTCAGWNGSEAEKSIEHAWHSVFFLVVLQMKLWSYRYIRLHYTHTHSVFIQRISLRSCLLQIKLQLHNYMMNPKQKDLIKNVFGQ